VQSVIKDYPSHGILAYNEDYIDANNTHVFVPVDNLLGIFDTYVYTKDYFDPAPRLMQECRYFKKGFIYLRDKNIKDGGSVYFNRPANCLTDKVNKKNIDVLVSEINNVG
jgi:predicted ATP-dependent Lon-type protease